MLLKWAVYYTACAILDVCKRAYEANGNQWPEDIKQPIARKQEMLSLERVIQDHNAKYPSEKIIVDENAKPYSMVSLSIAAYAMLGVTMLVTTSIGYLLPTLSHDAEEIVNPEPTEYPQKEKVPA